MRRLILAVGVLLGTTSVGLAADDEWYLSAHAVYNSDPDLEYRIVVYLRIDAIDYYWDDYSYVGPVPVGMGLYAWSRPYHEIDCNPELADEVFGNTQHRVPPNGEWEFVEQKNYTPVP